MIEFLILFFFLGIFSLLKKQISFLKKYNIPPSLSASLVVLLFFSLVPEYKTSVIHKSWKSLPAELIAMVFASLYLDKQTQDTAKDGLRKDVIGQTFLVWISILGQTIIGLLLTFFIFTPFFNLPSSFAMILETGFAGGHGTAFVMQKPFEDTGLSGGLEYGLTSATIGLFAGIFGGIYCIRKTLHITKLAESDIQENLTVSLSSIMISFLLIIVAYFLGVWSQKYIESQVFLQLKLPLFIYCIFTAILLRKFLQTIAFDNHLDFQSNSLVASIIMEVLIFAGIATIDISVVASALIPMGILFLVGFCWNLFSFFKLSKLFLSEKNSLPISFINFGMLNGTTATGLMLLKMSGIRGQAEASRIYSLSSPFTSPFIGGGLLTVFLPYMLMKISPLIIAGILVLVCISLYSVWKLFSVRLV